MINVTRLKANSRNELFQFLGDIFGNDEVGEPITVTEKYWCHIVGELKKATGKKYTDKGGFECDVMQPLPGYHANIVTNDNEIIKALKPLTVEVTNPLIKICGE